jgi:hypothetical protein
VIAVNVHQREVGPDRLLLLIACHIGKLGTGAKPVPLNCLPAPVFIVISAVNAA